MAFYIPPQDLENNQPLLQPTTLSPSPEPTTQKHGKGFKLLIITLSCILIMLSLVALMSSLLSMESTTARPRVVVSRGKKEGLSEKAFRGGETVTTPEYSFAWTKDMLSWQRSGYHFQPKKNWMSDPDGPMYYKGYYHIFYQYNPDSAVWGNITWAHAVSKDLLHWEHLPFAIVPNEWYEISGAWGGSATILPDGRVMMLYTGGTQDRTQVINIAYAANASDPLLREWVKYPGNPILTPPEGIGSQDFRDPTTAWVDPNGVWRFMIGSKRNRSGVSLIFKTTDFKSFELEGNLHAVDGNGMWECVDFFPVSLDSKKAHEIGEYGPGMKHFLKASMDELRHDDYALGTYDSNTQTWTPDYPELDVGIGLRLDYGNFYTSKSFYDPLKQRRILWGYVGERDTEDDDKLKGWACMQNLPRVITYDAKTTTHVLQWPIEELESLRKDHKVYDNVLLQPGSVINLNITSASQLDVSVEFVVDHEALESVEGNDVIQNCKPATDRQALGPFGLLVLADEYLTELTPVYFLISKPFDGPKKWLCTEQSRSTNAVGVDKDVHGGPVPVLEDENYNMRVLVDHSIVEVFGQGGRTCITSRIYPTRAVNGNSRIFLFNNGTASSVKATVNIWKLDSV